jgi:hypothetical protein
VRAERAIARRAVEAMRACGFERRRPKSYRGDEQELQMNYALEILLGLPQRGERRYIKALMPFIEA